MDFWPSRSQKIHTTSKYRFSKNPGASLLTGVFNLQIAIHFGTAVC